jgi:peptidyl-prolyl cis-trans isomerase D
MLSFFRRASKSRIGTWIMALIGIAILAGFALADLSNFGSGNIGFGGMNISTLAEVGDQKVTEREMSSAMQRRLQQVREQKADADYATIMGDFEAILDELIDQQTLFAFADKFNFRLSKRLIDADIAQLPQTRGPDGKFDLSAYQQFLSQERLSDGEVRQILAGGLLQRMILTPVASNARVSVDMAKPYATMMLESRQGQAAAISTDAFRAGLKPTDADIQGYYSANRNRYMVPEQREIRYARIGDEQVANVEASEQEVAAYYNSHKVDYEPKETRTISQAVVPDQATANQIAARAKGGATLAAAAAPAGSKAAVTTLNDQTREAYSGVAGDKAASVVFAAASGSVAGPVQTDFGWLLAKVDSVKTTGGKSPDQARAEIAAKLTAGKRKNAIEDLIDKVQDAVDGGSNFVEAAAAAKLTVSTTPLVTVSGQSRAEPGYKLPEELAPILKTGFEIAPNDPPEIVTLANDKGYAMISPDRVVHAAPAPLASIKDRVTEDWIHSKALARARAAASQAEAKVRKGMSLAQALKESGAQPAVTPIAAQRIQIATAQGTVPPPLKVLFTLTQGSSKMFPDPEGRGFFIVKVDKITPGNPLLQPALIGSMQTELQGGLSDEYARQFMSAIGKQLKVERNEKAIQAMKSRLISSGG